MSSETKAYLRKFIEFILVASVAVFIIPAAKRAFFPNQMDRLEGALRDFRMEGYHVAVDRKDDLEIILTVFDGGKSITAQIYRDVVRELDPTGDRRIFSTHAINRNSGNHFFLSKVILETDEEVKKLHRIEVSVCGRIKDQTGNVKYDGHEPIYECEVPIQKITASAKK